MNITDVRVRRVAKEGKMKAVVSITIDEEFVVHDIKVIEGEKGLFIAMPSRKATDGEYRTSHIRLTLKPVKGSRVLSWKNTNRYLQKNLQKLKLKHDHDMFKKTVCNRRRSFSITTAVNEPHIFSAAFLYSEIFAQKVPGYGWTV